MALNNKDELTQIILIMCVAESRAFIESESAKIRELENVVFDFVENNACQPIFFIMKDKKIKQATKALGEAAHDEFLLAVKRQDYLRARQCTSKGAQDIFRASLGEETFTVIQERLSPYCKMLTDWDAFENTELQLIGAGIGRSIRKELARRLLYTGPID